MQNQDKIYIKEAIYASSEKNLNSYPGFGYRTHSPSVDRALLKDTGYNRVSDIIFGYDNLKDNVKFPISFVFEPVTTDAGVEKFVFRRTVFIGVEYGYFNEGVGGQRVGSNFIAHSIFFDTLPPPEIFDLLLDNNAFGNHVFQPSDYECRPDNPELKKLLTGAPEMMPENFFDLTKAKDISQYYPVVDELCGEMMIAALQYYYDAKQKPANEFRHILVKAPHAATNKLIWAVKRFLPPKFAKHLYFTTNFSEGTLPPYKSNIHLVFVNEFYKATIYDDNHHIFLNAEGAKRNIEDNKFFDKIRKLIKSGEIDLLRRLLFFLDEIEIKSPSDWGFVYQLFAVTISDKKIALNDISAEFIQRLSKPDLAAQSKQIWNNIGEAVNGSLQSEQTHDIIHAIEVIQRTPTGKIHISETSKKDLTKFLFGEKHQFSKIVNEGNVKIISQIIDPETIDSFDAFINSLQTSHSLDIWKIFIDKCIKPDEKNEHSDTIISGLLKSSLPENTKKTLLKYIYPLSNSKELFFKYVTAHPDDLKKLSEILESICMSSHKECFSELISIINNDGTLPVISPMIEKYYRKKLEKSNACLEELVQFITNITNIKFDLLNLQGLLHDFALSIRENPMVRSKDAIDSLLNLSVKMNPETLNLYQKMQSVFCSETPKTVSASDMIFAYRLSKENLLQSIFDKWLESGLGRDDLIEFIANTEKLNNSPQLVEYMVVAIWKSNIKTKNELVETVLHHAIWKKEAYNKFIKSGEHPELVQFITKSSGFFNKMIQSIFGKK